MVSFGRKALRPLALRGMDIRGGKPSLQAQGVQRGVDQSGIYLPQSRTAQRVHIFIPTAILHMIQAVFNPPVAAEHSPSNCFGLALAGNSRLVSRYQCSRLTSPVAISTVSFSTIAPLPRAGESPTPPGHSRPVSHQSRFAVFCRLRPAFFLQGLSLQAPPASSPANPSGQCRQHLGLVPLDPHQVVPPGSPVRS